MFLPGKPISVKLIGVIADKVGLKQLCGDVPNVYVNADTSQKCISQFLDPNLEVDMGK